jgi:hypothetical protein
VDPFWKRKIKWKTRAGTDDTGDPRLGCGEFKKYVKAMGTTSDDN